MDKKLSWQSDTAEVIWKMLTHAEFELAPSGYRSAALPVELSSPQGLEASFIQFQCTRYSSDNWTLIHERMCNVAGTSQYAFVALGCQNIFSGMWLPGLSLMIGGVPKRCYCSSLGIVMSIPKECRAIRLGQDRLQHHFKYCSCSCVY